MALGILKNLLGGNTDAQTSATPTTYTDGSARTHNYKSLGFSDAGHAGAATDALIPNLHAAKARIQKELAEDKIIQEGERKKIRDEIAQLQSDKAGKELDIKLAKEDLQRAEDDIEKSKEEIASIKQDPSQIVENPTDKLGFYIGLFIILCLTIYLWVFYSSASYTAFFREIDTTLSFTQKVLEPNAITKALADGPSELIFVAFVPFIFLGLGYLIHKFGEQESKVKYIKIGALVLVTFVFDFLIAYNIEYNVYEYKRATSFKEMPEYNMSMAFQSKEFWLIIFSGFIVYLIWGFIFDFVMEAYAKFNVVKVAIDKLEANIRYKKTQCNGYKKTIADGVAEIKSIDVKIEQKSHELNKVVYPINILVDCLNSYLAGWINYMAGAGKTEEEQNSARITGEKTIGMISVVPTNNNN